MKKNFNSSIEHQDPEFYKLLSAETARQEEHIELIASENYASVAVMEACGTLLTNKYFKPPNVILGHFLSNATILSRISH